jgi:hypothetical protein
MGREDSTAPLPEMMLIGSAHAPSQPDTVAADSQAGAGEPASLGGYRSRQNQENAQADSAESAQAYRPVNGTDIVMGITASQSTLAYLGSTPVFLSPSKNTGSPAW